MERELLFRQTASKTFKSVTVETGLGSGDTIEIRSGLKEGVVVITGTYPLNSEYIFKKGINPMVGHDMNAMQGFKNVNDITFFINCVTTDTNSRCILSDH